MENLLRDLRLAARNLLKNRGFTFAALLCLGLGMGASSTIFSVVNAVLLQPLPFGDPDRVVIAWNQFLLQDTPKAPFSGREYLDLRDQNSVFTDLTVVGPQFVSYIEKDEPLELLAGKGTASLFPVLGVHAFLGHVFTPEEDEPGKPDVVLLTYKFWTEHFGSDRSIVGRKIIIDNRPFIVTGVLPDGFSFGTYHFDLWIPQRLNPTKLMPRQIRTVTLAARLKPGISLGQAQVQMNAIAQRFQHDDPAAYPAGSGYGIHLVPASEDLVGGVRTTLLVLFGAVALVLVIACLNVANLLLTRATSRAKEVAIRTALGSSRGILIRQFLTEGILLSLLGSALGLLFAFWATRLLVAFNPGNVPRLDQTRLDGTVLLYTLGLVVVIGGVFGLVPALHSTGRNLRDPLSSGGKTSGGGSSGQRTRSALVIAEIALAMVVLVGTGLMVQSFRHLLAVNPGFRTHGLLTARFTLTVARYPDKLKLPGVQRRVLEAAGAVPGIASVALASELPMGVGLNLSGDIVAEGLVLGPTDPPPVTGWRAVSADYFKAMEIPLIQGRAFLLTDDESAPQVVILDEALARRLWPGQNPLGKRLKLNAPSIDQSNWRTVVGIVGHIRQQGLAESGGDQLYVPVAQFTTRLLTLVAHPAAQTTGLARGVRDAVSTVDRALPVDIKTIDEVIDKSLTRERFDTLLFVSFGFIALALTLIGVYGVMSYSVAQRLRDVGIRMALGAAKEDVLRLIVGQGARLAVLGLALGAVAAWMLSRLMLSLLYGVEAGDVATFAGVALLLGILALGASYLPARRAAKVDPLIALRAE
jgi:putative ABC transport system permease protein